ncbi:DUF2007 domain-containing protein [Tundrisphaera lichenicola]|uniref:putative signal transducing protein n=1 Tax=Tundrisphaera lichenicola TaxID=2029860 RepID=UPI003EB6D354
MWTCPKCASKVDPSFEVCWNCGTSPDGVVDPSFVRADDAGPIESDPIIPELDVEHSGPVIHELPEALQGGELVEAYRALDLMEAGFLADQLNEADIPAAHDTHDLHATLGSMVEGNPRIWVRAEDLPRARAWLATYEKNKATPIDE